MNDTYREVKDRIRKLDETLVKGGTSNVQLAQALSAVRRLVKKGDRSREPSLEIKASLDKAEALGRTAVAP
jgi:translation initiation factor 2B subunit (eIF-2B alpha/beta/delta family)